MRKHKILVNIARKVSCCDYFNLKEINIPLKKGNFDVLILMTILSTSFLLISCPYIWEKTGIHDNYYTN